MTASAKRPGSPSGSPQIARTSSSNWLTAQASIVQWPELCGRGASSLTRSRPSRVTNISTASRPDQPELARDPLGERLRLLGERRGDRRRRHGPGQDVALVPVLDRRVAGHGAVLAAGGDHRDLAGEVDPRLGDRRRAAEARPGGGRVVIRAKRELALAVVAEARGLEDDRALQPRPAPRPGRRHCGYGAPGGGRDARSVEKRLLAQAILADREHCGRRAHRHAPGEPGERLDRQVLELDRDHVDRAGRTARAPRGRHRRRRSPGW